MRWILSSVSEGAPSGLAFFTGSMEVAQTDEGLFLVPAVAQCQGDAFVFPSLSAASACARILNDHKVGDVGFSPIPHLGDAAS